MIIIKTVFIIVEPTLEKKKINFYFELKSNKIFFYCPQQSLDRPRCPEMFLFLCEFGKQRQRQ